MFKYLVVVLVSLLFFGCSVKKEIQVVDTKLQDLVEIQQDIKQYTNDIYVDTLYESQNNYEKSYYGMWEIDQPEQTIEDINWSFSSFDVNNSYGEDLLPRDEEFFSKMYEESNFEKYKTINKKAITIKYANIRAFPTNKPILYDPSLAGEGFPFDYLQNSSINPNVPIFVSHYSKSKEWVFIFSSYTYGWVKSDEIVFISNPHAKSIMDSKQIVITSDGVPIKTSDENFLFNSRVGMRFPIIEEKNDSFIVLTISSYKNNKAFFNRSVISKDISTKETLILNQENLNKVISEVSKTNYGWGGIYEQRDCSSTLRDLYAPFGIWLPRNSSKQSEVGEVIDLSLMDNTQKTEFIKNNAIPFQTLLYKRGHIVLYVGVVNDNIIIFHNTWGIKTKTDGKEGRFLVGKTIFSTLKIGDELENYDEEAQLLKNIKSMNIITK